MLTHLLLHKSALIKQKGVCRSVIIIQYYMKRLRSIAPVLHKPLILLLNSFIHTYSQYIFADVTATLSGV